MPISKIDYAATSAFFSGRVKFLGKNFTTFNFTKNFLLTGAVHLLEIKGFLKRSCESLPDFLTPGSPVLDSRKRIKNRAPPLSVAERDAGLVLETNYSVGFCNGKPMCRKNASLSAFVLAVVTIVIDIPKTSLSSSSAVSGKMVLSLIPSV